jgi:hypothetical protein
VVVIAGILVAAGFLVPVPTKFTLSVQSQGLTPSVVYHTFPSGTSISFRWTTADGGSVTFSLVDAQGHVLARSTASSGNYTFTADGSGYGFQSYSWLYEVVNVHGSYSAAVLP